MKKEGRRVQRKKTFLVVCFSILGSSLWAQIAPAGVLKNSGLVVMGPEAKPVTLLHTVPLEECFDMREYLARNRAYIFSLPLNVFIDSYRSGYYGSYMANLGFFCKKELEIEKTTHLPLRFRLGSLQEVNRLEGKPGW